LNVRYNHFIDNPVSALEFDSVVVLESLPANQRKTGKWLYDNVLIPHAATQPDFVVHYNLVRGKDHFLAALKAVEEQMIDIAHRPIIHIEAHGDRDQIFFADGSSIEWDELRSTLTRMNMKSQFNLFLVMAMCEGWWSSRLLLPFEPAPAWGVLGPTVRVRDVDLRDAMEAFYREIFNSFGALPAVEAMNQHLPADDWKFLFMPAEMLFCMAFRRYVQEATPENLQARENEIVAHFARGKGAYDVRATMQARVQAREMLRNNHREFFEKCRREFFMLDEIPDNADRFRVSYQICAEGNAISSGVSGASATP
jgi:hypothetical protein